jgi:hypothetical protein
MMIPGLEERLMNGSEEDSININEMVRSVNGTILTLIKAFLL